MIRIEGEIVINRPVDELFDFVADARNEPRYNPRMLRAEKLSPGPIGLGTRFRHEVKSMDDRLRSPSRSSAMSDPGGSRIRSTCPRWISGEGSRSTPCPQGPDAVVMGPDASRVFKLLTPMVARVGRRQEQRIWAGLKRVMEAQAALYSAAGL